MKLKQWLYGATALAMLAACSDKDIVPDTGGDELIEKSEGYIGIRIQMPTVPSTRAFDPDKVGNDNFDDGNSAEYTLNKATLVLFKCDKTESAPTPQKAKCIGAFDLQKSKTQADKDQSGQITTEVIRFAKVTDMDKSNTQTLYALVIANGDTYGFTEAVLKSNTFKGKTIQGFQETVTDKDLYVRDANNPNYATDILMTNSPLSTYKGGSNNPNLIPAQDGTSEATETAEISILPVLVELDPQTYETEAEAISHPAGIIHIERAVGKVTCSNFNKSTTVKVQVGDKNYALEIDQIKWALAQDMKNTYLVRNTNRYAIGSNTKKLWAWNYATSNTLPTSFTSGGGKYRMLGHTSIVAGDETFYRPYFCQVPGYGVGKDGENDDVFEKKEFRGTESTKTGADYIEPSDAVDWNNKYAFYPHENTFPVEYMKYANTTRVGFWVTYKFKELDNNGNVVTVDGQPKYLDMRDKSFYVRGFDRSVIYKENPLEQMAGEYLKKQADVKTAVEACLTDEYKNSGYTGLDLSKLITFTWNPSTKLNGEVVITDVAFKKRASLQDTDRSKFEAKFDELDSSILKDYITNMNDLEVVYEYEGGQAFYETRIMHFGEDLTPWDREGHTKASDINESYGDDELERAVNYLGRYGIVRNNWYDLNVTNVKKLGDPVDPAKWENAWPGKPDDNKDEYIAVILRVLSWAKRTQKVEF